MEFEQKREEIADVLVMVGGIVMAAVILFFIGWVIYRLPGHIDEFEWKKLLTLFSEKERGRFVGMFFNSFQWSGLLFACGWATLMTGDIIGQMDPDQNDTDRARAFIGLTFLLLSASMSVILLFLGETSLFYVPLILCLIGSYVGDTEKDEKDKDLLSSQEDETE